MKLNVRSNRFECGHKQNAIFSVVLSGAFIFRGERGATHYSILFRCGTGSDICSPRNPAIQTTCLKHRAPSSARHQEMGFKSISGNLTHLEKLRYLVVL